MKLTLRLGEDERLVFQAIGDELLVRRERMYGTGWATREHILLPINKLNETNALLARIEKLLVLE